MDMGASHERFFNVGSVELMNIEIRREKLQNELDSKKTQEERNKLGQFSTPYRLASEIMDYVKELVPNENISFLEPSIGTGVFYSAFLSKFGQTNTRALGFEIDPHYCDPTRRLWSGFNLELKLADFLETDIGDVPPFDLIVTNPPYSRHHHIPCEKKKFLQNQVLKYTGVKISGLAGLYCYFLILSTKWLRKGGLSCWLIPSEFMDVNYGNAVKNFLLNNVELIRIHKFEAEDMQFSDAMVTSSVIVFRNNPPSNNSILFSGGGTLTSPSKSRWILPKNLDPSEKWGRFFYDRKFEKASSATLGDFFTIKRGLVTGSNKFFLLTKNTIEKYEIPPEFLLPVLQSPRCITYDLIDNSCLDEGKIEYLFNCSLPESELRKFYPSVWNYVNCGRKLGVHKGYICSRRSPWYSCERRAPAPFMIPYMCRNRKSNRTFRFILNKTSAIATNVYLMLYLKPEYEKLANKDNLLNKLWRELNSVSVDAISMHGRIYGGGLQKIEPGELMNIPANGIKNILRSMIIPQQTVLF